VCKKSIKNSQPFVKKDEKCQDPSWGIFLIHTVYNVAFSKWESHRDFKFGVGMTVKYV